MKIIFLRHGKADWPNWDKADDERPLTKAGRDEMKRVARFLTALKFSPDMILASPLPRARQTAEITAEHLGVGLQIEPDLAPGFNRERLRRLIGKTKGGCILIVGHEPDFSSTIKELTGGKVKLSKAGIALVETDGGCSEAELRWLFPPKILKGL